MKHPLVPALSTAIVVVGIALLIAFNYSAGRDREQPLSGSASRATPECVVTTNSKAVVGNQESRTLLAENTLRAWARIQLVQDSAGIATNTVALSVDEGAAAVLGSGPVLSTSTPTLYVGLSTDYPYTGAVTGITTTGSTTVQVTECVFP